MKPRLRAALVGVALTTSGLIVAGCAGYHVGSISKADYHSVAVLTFQNRTTQPEPGLEQQITGAILKRLQADGTLRIESQDHADIVLTGKITHYRRLRLRSLRDLSSVPREYRITITAKVEAHNRITGDVVLKPTVVSGSADTFIGNDLQSADFQALPLVADDMARTIVSLLAESW